MPTGRRDSAGDGLDLTAGASSSSDETSTDCKDSAYVSSEGLPLMDTSPPPMRSPCPMGPEMVYDRLTALAIIATSPESPLLSDSSPPSEPLPAGRQRSFSLSALHSYARPPLPQHLSHAVSHCPSAFGRSDQELGFVDTSSTTRGPGLVLTPEDRSAAYTLSTMAQQRTVVAPAPAEPTSSAQNSPSKKAGSGGNTRTRHVSWPDPSKPRRPMNGFMLFAQKHRGEYSHLHPGKDNRAISVMLGDQWRKMKSEEKKLYSLEAKVRADEVKKVHPDCWKRKRSYSTSL